MSIVWLWNNCLLLLCRLTVEARKLIADLGSSEIDNLGFRDNWIFVGGKGIKTKSPFEQVTQRNSNDTPYALI